MGYRTVLVSELVRAVAWLLLGAGLGVAAVLLGVAVVIQVQA